MKIIDKNGTKNHIISCFLNFQNYKKKIVPYMFKCDIPELHINYTWKTWPAVTKKRNDSEKGGVSNEA